MKLNVVCSSVIVSLSLIGCGGGGGGEPTQQAAPAKAKEGLFVSSGGALFSFVLDRNYQINLDGAESWRVDDFNSRGEPTFFMQGKFELVDKTTTQSQPAITVSRFRSMNTVTAINGTNLTTTPVTFSETQEPTPVTFVQITDPLPAGGSTGARSAFRGVANNFGSTPFEYDQPAMLSNFAGSWEFFGDSSRIAPKASLSVSATGTFSGINEATGCSYQGQFVPRPTGKNVLDVTLLLTGCTGSGMYSGIAFSFQGTPYPAVGQASAGPILTVMTINANRSRVFALQMFKPRV